MFVVRAAVDLNPERDTVLIVPTEGNNKQNFHRVPIRAAPEAGAPLPNEVADVAGGLRVAPTPAGLRRLLIKFPESFCHGIKEFDNTESDRQNLSLGFALFDHRVGPTSEQARVLENIDALSGCIRRTMYGCERIRTMLGFGSSKMSEDKQRTLAEEMDLWISKPINEDTPQPITNNKRGHALAAAAVPDPRPHCRYCYVKMVPPSPSVNDMFLTYLWTPDGRPMGFETVRRMQNFKVVPFVELEDIFVSKALRSLQMKLRECIIIPPPERPSHRFSAAFPHRVCTRDAAEGLACPLNDLADASVVAKAADDAPQTPPPSPKRQRVTVDTTTELLSTPATVPPPTPPGCEPVVVEVDAIVDGAALSTSEFDEDATLLYEEEEVAIRSPSSAH
jgi:hypothetical protein